MLLAAHSGEGGRRIRADDCAQVRATVVERSDPVAG
jgi:hypothetical protein